MAWLVVSSYVIHIYLLLTSLSLLACSGDVVLACFVPKMDVEDRHWIAKEHVENNWSFVHTTDEFGTRPGPTRSCRKNRNISCYLCTFFPRLFLGPLLLHHQHHHRYHIRDPVPCPIHASCIRTWSGLAVVDLIRRIILLWLPKAPMLLLLAGRWWWWWPP